MSLRNEQPLNGQMNENLSNNSSIYSSCPNVNYAANLEENGPRFQLMNNYSNGPTNQNINNGNWTNMSLLNAQNQRKSSFQKPRERQLSSSFSGKSLEIK